jgi:hypothetical protein
MLHHLMEESGRLHITMLTRAGCDGPVKFRLTKGTA